MPPVLAAGERTSLLRNYGKTGRYDIRDCLLGGICIPRSSEKLEHAKFVNGALPRSYADNARRGLFTSLDLYGAPQHVTTLSHGVNRLRRHPRGSERELCTILQMNFAELPFRDCLESRGRVLDRLCLVLQEGEMGHFRPLLATLYTPNRGLLGLSRQSRKGHSRKLAQALYCVIQLTRVAA